jgi:hypothetical protein
VVGGLVPLMCVAAFYGLLAGGAEEARRVVALAVNSQEYRHAGQAAACAHAPLGDSCGLVEPFGALWVQDPATDAGDGRYARDAGDASDGDGRGGDGRDGYGDRHVFAQDRRLAVVAEETVSVVQIIIDFHDPPHCAGLSTRAAHTPLPYRALIAGPFCALLVVQRVTLFHKALLNSGLAAEADEACLVVYTTRVHILVRDGTAAALAREGF